MSRIFHVDVEEFAFGFPPRIASFKKNGTTYAVNAIPLGGYVKIKGEEGTVDPNDKNSFANQPVWKRAIIVIAGVVFNIVLSFIILSILFSVGMPAVVDSTTINELVKSGARIKNKEIIINDVAPSSPAVDKLKANDRIIGFGITNNQNKNNTNTFMADIYTLNGFQSFVDMHKGEDIALKIKRDDKVSVVNVIPRVNPPEGQGAIGIAYMGAITYTYPFGRNIVEAWKYIVQSIDLMFHSIGKAFASIFHFKTQTQEVAGPVGIAVLTQKISKMGSGFFFAFMASLSINLAFMNLLPIPALDGGKLLFLLFEQIKGSALNKKFENYATIGGFAFLMILVLIVTIKDVISLF